MRIDAHQHFWDLEKFAYPWMPPAPSPLTRTFLPEHLSPILERNRIDGSVVVQATTDAGEADWLLELADRYAFVRGVVAWVDLTDAHVGDALDRLQKHSRFKGVRHPVHDEPDDRWLLRDDVLRGLRELERRAIPFDLLLRPQHLACVIPLAEKLPDLLLVVDHIAKPLIRDRVFEPWAAEMAKIAQAGNIHVKLSGMITEGDASALPPYVRHVWETFGPRRCMFGSDWPVCLLAGSWKEVLASLTQSLGAQPQESRDWLMGETAAQFYAL